MLCRSLVVSFVVLVMMLTGPARALAEGVAVDRPDAKAHDNAAKALAAAGPTMLEWPYSHYCVSGYRVVPSLEPGMGRIARQGEIMTPKGYAPIAALQNPIAAAPTEVFDNVYYVGNNFIGTLVFKTSAGLVLVDTMNNGTDVDRYLVPGLKTLHLDIKDVKWIILTHKHSDHYGGINRILQLAPDAKVAVGKPDADALMAQRRAGLPPNASEKQKQAYALLPRRFDLEVSAYPGLQNGLRELIVGGTHFTLALVPSHTPGMLSIIVPVTWKWAHHVVAIWGGDHVDNPDAVQKARQYASSLEFFHSLAELAGVDAVIQPHIYQNDGFLRLEEMQSHPGMRNPFVIGADAYDRYVSIWTQCMQAFGRRMDEGTWNRF